MKVLSGLEISAVQRCNKVTGFSRHIYNLTFSKSFFLKGNSRDQLLNIISQLHVN